MIGPMPLTVKAIFDGGPMHDKFLRIYYEKEVRYVPLFGPHYVYRMVTRRGQVYYYKLRRVDHGISG